MLVIRNTQVDALVAARAEPLRTWLHPHLRTHFHDRLKDTDDAALATLIDRSVARALVLGARRSQTIRKFVYLRVLFDEGFEALPWAAETLASPDIADRDTRIELLHLRGRMALAGAGGGA